jgi:hypothetical protein
LEAWHPAVLINQSKGVGGAGALQRSSCAALAKEGILDVGMAAPTRMVEKRSRPFWVLCIAFGAGVIAFVVWFAGVIPTRTCTGPLPGGVSALLAFQLARTPADIETVFGPPDDPCRARMIMAMDRANRVDLVGFIATYTVFLACFFLALRRLGAHVVAGVGLIAVVASAAFDVLETATQLHITGALPGSSLSLTLLVIGSRGKFLGLAVVSTCAGWGMFVRGKVPGRVIGSVCIAAAALVVAGLLWLPARPALSAGGAIAWILMLLYALQAALRRA